MIKKAAIFSIVYIGKTIVKILSLSESSYQLIFIPGFENTRWNIGKWKSWVAYEHAKRHVPAYKEFCQDKSVPVKLDGFKVDMNSFPITDKESYIKKYSIESRCVNGKIPTIGVVIDESSGTSGTPNNWVRAKPDRKSVTRNLQIGLHHLIGKEPYFIINAFALGPWATGMNVSMSFVDISILKSTGPDLKKIENTLNQFGPKYKYIIMGYPPFLKNLVDDTNIKWEEFNITAIYGGEGITEGMRDYLKKAFKRIYGSYGASDLEINIGYETDFTIALRRVFEQNKELSEDVFNKNESSPVIFQFNPLDYFIESNDKGELIITICRDSNTCPKIRYNIHDSGFVMRMPQLIEKLQKHNIKIESIGKPESDLPFLFHFGRSDLAVAFYGCKITPTNINEIIFSDKKMSSLINSFMIMTKEDAKLNKKLTIAIELKEKKKVKSIKKEELRKIIFKRLAEINQDFRESIKMVPKGNEPDILIYENSKGPFENQDLRLKKKYIEEKK